MSERRKVEEEQKRRERMANYKEKIRLYYEKHPEQEKLYHKKTAGWLAQEARWREEAITIE